MTENQHFDDRPFDDRPFDDRPSDDRPSDDRPLDPQEALRILTEQEEVSRRALDFPEHLMYLLWGLVYLLGYLPMALSVGPDAPLDLPLGLALGIFFVLLLGGIGASVALSIRHGAGVGGDSARRGMYYGFAWWLSFAGVFGLTAHLGRLGIMGDDMGVAINGASMIVVAALFMAGGAIWLDRTQFVVGGAIAAVTTVALFLGLPAYYWVMCQGVGGLLLLAALIEWRRDRGASGGASGGAASGGAASGGVASGSAR